MKLGNSYEKSDKNEMLYPGLVILLNLVINILGKENRG